MGLIASALQPSPERQPLLKKSEEKQMEAYAYWRKLARDLTAVVVIVSVGVAVLMSCEQWSAITAFYVLTQIITTIGYGDFTVKSSTAAVFMGFYAFFVLVVLAYFFNSILGGFFERQEEVMRKHLRNLQANDADGDGKIDAVDDYRAYMKYNALNKVLVYALLFVIALFAGTIFYRFYEHCTCQGLNSEARIAACDDTSFATCAATGGAVKGFTEAFYMSTITLTTVGFGDYQPRTPVGRLLAIAWMFCGVIVTASFISALSEYFFEYQQAGALSAAEFTSSVHEREFKNIDADGSGCLSRAEFLVYTLRKYGGVSEELFQQMNRAFDEIDTGGNNAVTLEMLKARQAAIRSQYAPVESSAC
mmetsp:Transcript_15686/g.36795  ORF Transcript_15686/g.36795 Transcript_15686/m.36795 type:complete len:363 (-) Transcript_15686:72-1160(-)|eukprot:CAMPEP_0178414912 /NCGR_PEP_ID=MMETSP0689_2-20121128/23280_1 /TAXON_ID=160604 /ORGANISM="Amphidinium massartii, Strain CS-259" /LENGTH=362 /DNA_ID=CAMNT_0020036215 /DNA_START=159 /DNA_END=1247 /DNA_ORIENTATION=+